MVWCLSQGSCNEATVFEKADFQGLRLGLYKLSEGQIMFGVNQSNKLFPLKNHLMGMMLRKRGLAASRPSG